jgi:ABC-type antimicrobial peptide transport system permease subunit
MELSAAGLIGAFLGLVAGWASYLFVANLLERKLRELDKSESPADRSEFENKIALMRRLILAIEVIALTAVGYALGQIIGG